MWREESEFILKKDVFEENYSLSVPTPQSLSLGDG